MTDEQIERSLKDFIRKPAYSRDGRWKLKNDLNPNVLLDYINRINADKQKAETQLRELFSALYQRTGEKGFTLYRKDIAELAQDYGIKEEELK